MQRAETVLSILRKSCSTPETTGEPDTSKGVCPVLKEGCRNLPTGKALHPYLITVGQQPEKYDFGRREV